MALTISRRRDSARTSAAMSTGSDQRMGPLSQPGAAAPSSPTASPSYGQRLIKALTIKQQQGIWGNFKM